MTREQVENGARLCLKKVRSILNDVEILCVNDGSEPTAVSLYTIAVEEFGKFLLLRGILNTKPKAGLYEVNKTIFGKGRSHRDKFEKAIEVLPEVCIEYHIRDISENENLFPIKYRERIQALREVISKMKNKCNPCINGTVALAFDFEVRKNLLYVDWNEEMNNWSTELVRDGYVEYCNSMDELESDWDTTLDHEWEKMVERSEEEAEIQLEDMNLDVEDVDYKNVRRLDYPQNLIFAIRFFKRYLNQSSNRF